MMLVALAIAAALYTPTPDVTVVQENAVPATTWQCLLGAGYTGRPDDGMEALYVPAKALTQCR